MKYVVFTKLESGNWFYGLYEERIEACRVAYDLNKEVCKETEIERLKIKNMPLD